MCEVRYDSVKIWLRKKVGYSLKNIVFEADVPCKSTKWVNLQLACVSKNCRSRASETSWSFAIGRGGNG